jgi:hypothetical protein
MASHYVKTTRMHFTNKLDRVLFIEPLSLVAFKLQLLFNKNEVISKPHSQKLTTKFLIYSE